MIMHSATNILLSTFFRDMNILSELLNKLDVKTNPLLAALFAVLVVAKCCYRGESMILDLSILLLGLYLLQILILWCYTAIKNKIKVRQYKIEESKKNDAIVNQATELIHNYFMELSEKKLQILVKIFQLPEVKGNKYKRVVPAYSPIRQFLLEDEYKIPIDFRRYLVVVKYNINYDFESPLVVEFEPTLYEDLLAFIHTGNR